MNSTPATLRAVRRRKRRAPTIRSASRFEELDDMAEPGIGDLISPGWDVFDSEHERIGTVDEVAPTYVAVTGETGTRLYVPLDAVEAAAGGEVSLDTPASEIGTLGWDAPPA
jgi:Uncharacterized protein conserved in bacteria (DUF2171)